MYHSISRSTDCYSHPYYDTTITPDVFDEQMGFLHRNNYVAINVDDAVQLLTIEESNGLEKFVVLTFDDGYRDFYTKAFPVLERYGFKATVFLPTDFIGENPLQFQGNECLSWSDVRELHKYGMSFGSHSVTHPRLVFLNEERLKYEIEHSRITIQEKLGSAVHSFSYPFAFPEENTKFTQKLRTLMEDSGYINGVSTILGTASALDDRLFLKRLPINSGDDLGLFGAKLEGAYDWLHSLQYIRKLAKSRFSSNRSQ